MKKRGQITVFIIVAIFIVVAGVAFFLFKDAIKNETVPQEIFPIYSSILSCIEESTLTGISILESTGGYIELPSFEPGSRVAPFSSQLTFAGIEIPYWNYVSASGLEKEKIPSLNDMETQLEEYINKKIIYCNLDEYYDQGYLISMNSLESEVTIKNNFVDVLLNLELNVQKDEDSYLVNSLETKVDSPLGSLYSASVEIYEKQKEEMFLEEYSLDTLNLYAPLEGLEFSCSPLVWEAYEVFNNVSFAIDSNIMAIDNKKEKDDYFYQDFPKDVDVNFITSVKNWPTYFEVNPSEDEILIAEPIGNQQGLGILGFCYVAYHFVYDLKYPVLIQTFKDGEIFQFPVIVRIEKNNPKKSLVNSVENYEKEDLCKNSNSLLKINTYDVDLNSIDSNISYRCFDSTCYLGGTINGELETLVPQCINGHLIFSSEGYETIDVLHSSVENSSTFVILNKEYLKKINLILEGQAFSKEAIITFESDKEIKTISYPSVNEIKLSEGNYEIQVYIYENSTLKFEDLTKEQCIETSYGIRGVFGIPKKECFEVSIPSDFAISVLVGGGNEEIYFSEFDLKNQNSLEISSNKFKTPNSLEEIQNNYLLFEVNNLEVNLK